MKIALEVAKSDLEEKAVVNKDGFAENFYKNAKMQMLAKKLSRNLMHHWKI
ncbi:hypothetical protein [Bacillus velezensis]|uniref:hypothetical protein n=1 Tax=Bacillus velezensis TaxID=492670 RepID=UPI000FB46D8E|nr:hypothetical protein [Bacillus velezensis]RUS00289.1 hypothetical protein EFW57_00726 [Bacillus velezensis]